MKEELFLIGDSFGGKNHGTSYFGHCADELKRFLGPAQEGDIIVYINSDDSENTPGLSFTRANFFFEEFGYEVVSIEHIPKPYTFFFQPKVKAIFIEGKDIYNLIHFLKDAELFDIITNLVINGQKKYIGCNAGTLISCPFVLSQDLSMTIPWSVVGFSFVDFQIHHDFSLKADESLAKWFRKFHDLSLYYLSKSNWLRMTDDQIIQGG